MLNNKTESAQQVPADGDGYRLAWEHLAANSYDHHTPYMVCIPTDEWKAAEAMLAATPQAPQPVVDDNGLIVHGDWYTVEHTGTHIFDLDDDRERLLSILLHSNGDVGFAARVEGVGGWQGKATDPVFREALAALGDPRRHDLALGANPPASQPQQGAVATVCLRGDTYAHGLMTELQVQHEAGVEFPIGTKLYTTIGQQAVDGACNCPGGSKPASLHAPNCPVRTTENK